MTRRRLRVVIAGTAASLVCASLAFGQAVADVPVTERTPTLEDLRAGTWPTTWRATDFRQRTPGDGVAASRETEAFLAHDRVRLYVGFRSRVDPADIRAHLAPRDEIQGDDSVSVYLDTFRDQRHTYVFSVNPLGVQYDALQPEGADLDDAFDANWNGDAALTVDGFVALIAIPFTSLRFPGGASQTWGVAFEVSIPRNNELSYWPAITDRIEGFAQQLSTIAIHGAIARGAGDVVPYLTIGRSRSLDTDLPGFSSSTDGRVGVDARLRVGSATAFDVAVNPDFSEIAPDEPLVTVNQRFEVVFPERRPFFLETARFFDAPDSLFYSRRVADPSIGGRVTANRSGWTVGALAAKDRTVTGDAADGAGVGVMRVQRDVGAQSRMAATATMRQSSSTSNVVAAVDTRLKLSDTWVFTGQLSRSSTTVESQVTGGSGGYASIARSGRALSYAAEYVDRGPEYDPQLGYVERVDIRQANQSAEYIWRPTNGPLQSFGPSVDVSAAWDHGGTRQDLYFEPAFRLSVAGPLDVQVTQVFHDERVDGRLFRQRRTGVSIQDSRWDVLRLDLGLAAGTAVHYEPAPGQAPSLGDSLALTLSAIWRPAPRVLVEQAYALTRLRERGTTARLFTNHLARTRANLQFTRRLSLRSILDYEAVLPGAGRTSRTDSRRMTSDVLLAYQVGPLTVLYVGYTDRSENLQMTSTTPVRVELRPTGRMSTDRRVFAKVGYLLPF